jgi:hypothetical protein
VSAIEQRLETLGLRLPRPMAPPPGYEFPFALVRISGGYAHASGHGPADGPDYLMRGKVGDALTVDEGYEAARLSALSMLAGLKDAVGDLDRVIGWVRARLRQLHARLPAHVPRRQRVQRPRARALGRGGTARPCCAGCRRTALRHPDRRRGDRRDRRLRARRRRRRHPHLPQSAAALCVTGGLSTSPLPASALWLAKAHFGNPDGPELQELIRATLSVYPPAL